MWGASRAGSGSGGDALGTGHGPPAPSTEEQEIVDWAFGLDEAAGLHLPEVEIGFHVTDAPCRGFRGYYEPRTEGPDMITVCSWHERDVLRDA